MPYRLVSPDLRLWFIDDDEGLKPDLKPIRALYGLTAAQTANVRQLLNGRVGNGRGDRNDRTERKEAANFMLLHNVSWLKHDNGTEYVPLVGKPEHIFDSGTYSVNAALATDWGAVAFAATPLFKRGVA